LPPREADTPHGNSFLPRSDIVKAHDGILNVYLALRMIGSPPHGIGARDVLRCALAGSVIDQRSHGSADAQGCGWGNRQFKFSGWD
jgi:hypothetical protein